MFATLLFIAVLIIASTSSSADSPASACEIPIRLEVEGPKSNAKVIGRFKGRKDDFAGLLRELSRESAACGTNRPVDVLVSDRHPLAVLNELRGLLSKAGLVNGRYYVISSKSGYMGEIMFGKVVPYAEEH